METVHKHTYEFCMTISLHANKYKFEDSVNC